MTTLDCGCKNLDNFNAVGMVNSSQLELGRSSFIDEDDEDDEEPKDMTLNANFQENEEGDEPEKLELLSESSNAYDSNHHHPNEVINNRNTVIKNPVSIVVPIDPREYLANSSEIQKSYSAQLSDRPGLTLPIKTSSSKAAQIDSPNFTSSLFNRLQLNSPINGSIEANLIRNNQIYPTRLASEQFFDYNSNSSDVEKCKKDCQLVGSESMLRIASLNGHAKDKLRLDMANYDNLNTNDNSCNTDSNNNSSNSDANSKVSYNRVKENRCPMCSQQFTQLNSLKRHIRSHTGERPFPCEYCDKRFVDRERLKVHIRIHTGEKPFSCSLCNRAFSQKSTVKRHMSVHTGLKPFQCSVDNCFKKFGTRDNLKMHERKTHNKVYSPSSSSDCLQTGQKESPHLNTATSRINNQVNQRSAQLNQANDLSTQSSCDSNMV